MDPQFYLVTIAWILTRLCSVLVEFGIFYVQFNSLDN